MFLLGLFLFILISGDAVFGNLSDSNNGDTHHLNKRGARNTPANCEPGSRWEANCQNCICDEDLQEVCEPIAGCGIEPLTCHHCHTKKPKCKSHKQINGDQCTRCDCNRHGVSVCKHKC